MREKYAEKASCRNMAPDSELRSNDGCMRLKREPSAHEMQQRRTAVSAALGVVTG